MRYKVASTTVFNKWLAKLADRQAVKAIVLRLTQIEAGVLGEIETVAGRVNKMNILVGQGYQIFFTMQGETIVILLCGDIENNKKVAAAG